MSRFGVVKLKLSKRIPVDFPRGPRRLDARVSVGDGLPKLALAKVGIV